MRKVPDFDELVGGEAAGEERERLRRVHDLLVEAGPPPELAPELEAGPTLAMTLQRQPGHHRRRLSLLAAAVAAMLLVFLGGYIVGNRSGTSNPEVTPVRILDLHGTSLAPEAFASLQLQLVDAAGNWPLTLDVTGLPALPARSYYELYLVRQGTPWLSCGTFEVSGGRHETTVALNAPYRLRPGDTWVVTRQLAGTSGPGPEVLRQSA